MQRKNDEVKDYLKSFKSEKCTDELSPFDEGFKESLEFVLNLQEQFKDKNSIEKLLLEYKNCIITRYESDILIDKNDITGGWLEGSLKGINWFFGDNL